MIRVAVVGNSHVGAIKLGWERAAAAWPGIMVEFFAAPGVSYGRLKMVAPMRFGLPEDSPAALADRLTRINGRTDIDLSAVDAVLLVGQAGGIGAVVELLAEHDVDGLPEDDPKLTPRRLSAAAFDACCEALAASSGRHRAAWRNWSRPQVFVLPRSRPSEVALRGPGHHPLHKDWRRLSGSPGKLEAGVTRYLDHLERALAATGITLLRQPAASLSAHGLTREDMTRGSLRIDGDAGHGEDDATHANAEYGALFWDTYAPRLADARQPA